MNVDEWFRGRVKLFIDLRLTNAWDVFAFSLLLTAVGFSVRSAWLLSHQCILPTMTPSALHSR